MNCPRSNEVGVHLQVHNDSLVYLPATCYFIFEVESVTTCIFPFAFECKAATEKLGLKLFMVRWKSYRRTLGQRGRSG